MLRDVKLPFFPSTTDCLAWSEDGELAIAAGESVHLLIPRRNYGKDLHKASSLDPWVHVSFKINSFTFDEWPPQELAKLADFSIGEEQSPSTVVALAWSPLGMARHSRFALAILTTNHVLSLWASTSDLRAASSWERVLVINQALKIPPLTSLIGQDESNPIDPRPSERIRSMSWAPQQSMPSAGTSSTFKTTSPDHSSPIQYLAVTNDANEAIVLRIRTFWSHDRCPWEAQIAARASWGSLESLAASAESKSATQENDPLTSAANMPNSLSHIALPSGASTINLLSWETSEKAAASAQPLSSTQFASRTLSLANDWDEISGLTFTSNPGHVVLHVSSLLSGSFAFHIPPDSQATGKDLEQIDCPYQSTFQDQVSGLQKAFDRRYDLGGQCHAKTWGVASWNSYVASCVTLHPSDMIEYSMPSDQLCQVIFSYENDSSGLTDDAIFPWQETSGTMHGEPCSAVLRKLLDVLKGDDMPQYIIGRMTLYNICCAAIITADIRNWKPVQQILQKLSVSTGISLDAEIGIIDDIEGSRLTLPRRIEQLREIASARIEDENPSIQQHLHSFCSICEQLITWESLTEAYSRCALTFLPITEPGITKHCETCDREFLDEAQARPSIDDGKVERDKYATAEMEIEQPATIGNTDEGSPQDPQPQLDDKGPRHLPNNLGLISTLFARFDVCPYCQGKFIS
ncbi:MAG: hypothetical protein Q9186_002801 [Xanthomendoza sp. 1 TL-2023]